MQARKSVLTRHKTAIGKSVGRKNHPFRVEKDRPRARAGVEPANKKINCPVTQFYAAFATARIKRTFTRARGLYPPFKGAARLRV